jgi:hypothetical protein
VDVAESLAIVVFGSESKGGYLYCQRGTLIGIALPSQRLQQQVDGPHALLVGDLESAVSQDIDLAQRMFQLLLFDAIVSFSRLVAGSW